MVEESSSMYGQAVAHAEDALQAARGKDLNKAVTHVKMAIEVAQRAQRDFDTMKVEPEAQHDFAEGVKSLEDAVNQANKGNSQLIEEKLIKALVLWHREPKGDEVCHGEGCPKLASGCCSQPGLTKCNRFYPLRKCTNAGSPCNACYCL
jgi:hypothetical protein